MWLSPEASTARRLPCQPYQNPLLARAKRVRTHRNMRTYLCASGNELAMLWQLIQHVPYGACDFAIEITDGQNMQTCSYIHKNSRASDCLRRSKLSIDHIASQSSALGLNVSFAVCFSTFPISIIMLRSYTSGSFEAQCAIAWHVICGDLQIEISL